MVLARFAPGAICSLLVVLCGCQGVGTGDPAACTSTASPGDDIAAAVRALPTGGTLCLREGEYHPGDEEIVRGDFTLKSYPGEMAQYKGGLLIIKGSNVVIRDLLFDQRTNDIGLYGDNIGVFNSVFTNEFGGADGDVTGSGTKIFVSGPDPHIDGHDDPDEPDFTQAHGFRAEGNLFRRIGRRDESNIFDHALYLGHTVGAKVIGNTFSEIYGGYAVHMYPDADRTLVKDNMIYNSYGFNVAGSGKTVSTDNVITNNAYAWTTGSQVPGVPPSQIKDRGPFLVLYQGESEGTSTVTLSHNVIHAPDAWHNDDPDGPDGQLPAVPGLEGTVGLTYENNHLFRNPLFKAPLMGDFSIEDQEAREFIAQGAG